MPTRLRVTFTAPSLLSAISRRRGPIGDLAASGANLETPLPTIDLVNECLEFMAAAPKPSNGTVYDTSADDLAGHLSVTPCLARPTVRSRLPSARRIFAALPEYSTPATPVGANSAVTPAVWNVLKKDFSSCRSAILSGARPLSHLLKAFGGCRVEEMRTFRKCITEFVLDPAKQPAGISADYLWRFPIRIDTAIEYLGITPEEYE